ncbi:MAG: hypothetical protein LUH15_13855 [Tannerellaceae bacterium]|nr:hypothetical protein [Tannerellaceae bacterium]
MNINAQMNYWPAEMCNLSELHTPFLDHIGNIAKNGAHTARNFFMPVGGRLAITPTSGHKPIRLAIWV